MRKVCRYGREILDIAAAAVKPGVTTDYIDEIVHKATIERNVRRIDTQRHTWNTN
jgi:methionyl aminopeptidase